MRQLILKSVKIFIFSILLIGSGACKKIQDSQVPSVPFFFEINLNVSNELTVPGNSMYFPNIAFGGVIVYCELPDSYYAYDATCTHEISQNCKVKNEGVLGTCSCCGSEFILIGGAFPSKGPAAAPLRQYNVTKVNEYTLRIYN